MQQSSVCNYWTQQHQLCEQAELHGGVSTDGNGDFSTFPSEVDRCIQQTISKDIVKHKISINCLSIMGICRLPYLTTVEYIFFSSSHRTLTKKYCTIDHKIIKQRTPNDMVSSSKLQRTLVKKRTTKSAGNFQHVMVIKQTSIYLTQRSDNT